MRKSHRLVTAVILLVAALGLTAVGQEEPLPPVKARVALAAQTQVNADAGLLLIDLPAEPSIPFTQPTLFSAAEGNDFATFDALYRAQRTSAYADLHALWTYAVTDPIGAFYGAEMHERFSRTYPNFAQYIAQYRIVDQNGRSFYPTAETRAFLLRYATSGEPARFALATPVDGGEVQVAQATERRRPAGLTRAVPAPPRVSSTARTTTRRRDAARPATETVALPVSEPIVVAQTPIVATPVPAAAPVVEAPQPVAAAPVAVAPQPIPIAPPKPAIASDPFTGRGILLLIVGLLGIGVLTLMMRTPKEDDEPVDEAPVAKVEPLRMPQEKKDAPRATGSHG